MDGKIRNFEPGRDRLFESIVDLSVVVESFFCHLLERTGNDPPPPGGFIALLPSHCRETIALPVTLNFGAIMGGVIPPLVQIQILTPEGLENARPLGTQMDTLGRVLARLVAPVFMLFYETHRPWWIGKFNRDPATWPAIMQFSRVIRNAIGHHMRIDWASPKLGPVEWRGLS
jgi:hypothetical protein